MKRAFIIFLVLAMALSMILGCGGEDKKTTIPDTNQTTAPTIPPASTLVMDFSQFPTASQATLPAYDRTASAAGTNFTFSAFNVGVWNLAITVGLAVPVAVFVESFNHSPVLQSDGSWDWTYNKTIGGVVHTATLNGSLSTSGINWEMYITKQGVYTDFNWFNGSHDFGLTSGTWTMMNSPSDPNELLLIQWNRNITAGTSDIKYTNIVPGGPENGGYIHYGITSDTAYNAYYNIYNKGQDNLVEIQWNTSTLAGRVRNEAHFGDTLWHGWDSGLQNVN